MTRVKLSALVHNKYTRTLLLVFGSLFILLFSIIAYSYHEHIESDKKCLHEKLETVSNTLVYQISPLEVKSFLKKHRRKDDITNNYSNPTYHKYHQLFANIKSSTGLKGEIYTMQYIAEKNCFEFGFSSNDNPHYRHEYKNFPEEILHNYTKGGKIDVYEDEHGTWVSAFVPIKYHEKTISIVQVDENFDDFITQARNQALTEALIIAAIALLASFILFRVASNFILSEEAHKEELRENNRLISSKNNQITSSIEYAKKIQEAILPKEHIIEKNFHGLFILYNPKDIVSGDFYWFSKKYGDSVFIAAVDCTGHGVPGALMSMISNALITEVINEDPTKSTGEILNCIEKKLKSSFDQKDSENTSDGMDLALCKINISTNVLEYSGAYRPLYLLRDKEIVINRGNRCSIGGEKRKDHTGYDSTEVNLFKGDRFYIFSDGYADQFGGHNGEQKFTMKRFKETLIDIQDIPMSKQGDKLEQIFLDWKKDIEQIDDVLVMGFEV